MKMLRILKWRRWECLMINLFQWLARRGGARRRGVRARRRVAKAACRCALSDASGTGRVRRPATTAAGQSDRNWSVPVAKWPPLAPPAPSPPARSKVGANGAAGSSTISTRISPSPDDSFLMTESSSITPRMCAACNFSPSPSYLIRFVPSPPTTSSFCPFLTKFPISFFLLPLM